MATPPLRGASERLDGWKNITGYLDCDEKTARTWFRESGLPVYRTSNSEKARVFAYAEELDAWKQGRVVSPSDMTVADGGVRIRGEEKSQRSKPRSDWKRQVTLAALLSIALASVIVVTAKYFDVKTVEPIRIGRVFARSTAERTSLRELPIPVTDGDFVLSSNGNEAFVVAHQQPLVHRVSIPSGVTVTFTVGAPVAKLALSPDQHFLYCATNRGVRRVNLVSGGTQDIDAGGTVFDLKVSPDGGTLYLAMGQRGIKKVDFARKTVEVISHDAAPFFIDLDPDGKVLYASFQNGGPSGRDGHDTVEAIALQDGRRTTSESGPPLVGGPAVFNPLTDSLWTQMWDACITDKYDHLGCPSIPAFGYQIFRARDMKLIKTLSWRNRYDGAVYFPGDASLAIVPGPTTKVLDSATFHTLEEIPVRSVSVSGSKDGTRVVVYGGNRLVVFEPTPRECLGMPSSPPAQRFSFDGTLEDAIEATAFTGQDDIAFVPGKVGQAVRLSETTTIKMRSPSGIRLGDVTIAEITLAFWFRSRGPGQLLGRETGVPWQITWSAGNIKFRMGDQIHFETPAEGQRWHHVTVRRKGDDHTFFLDGHLAGESHFQLGIPRNGVAEFTSTGDHDLDELMVFGESLDSAAIEALAAPSLPRCL